MLSSSDQVLSCRQLFIRERDLMLFAEGNPRLVGILQRRDATRTLLLHHYKI